MKARIIENAVLVAAFASLLLVGSALATRQPALTKKTAENLSTAMHGEAFAHAKYLLYAERARQSGNEELARLLEQTAKTERLEHFAEEARLAVLVSDNSANLTDAIQGESYEVETMYRKFAEEATAAGDHAAATLFDEIRRDEIKHRDAFTKALSEIRNEPVAGE
jgi:rubrerythrin